MAPRRSRPRRILPPIILALALAAEITGIALARTWVPAPAATPAPAAAMPRIEDGAGRTIRQPDPAPATILPTTPVAGPPGTIAAHGFRAAANARPAVGPVRATSTSGAPGPAASGGSHPASSAYQGRNHVWIPSLGVSKGIQSFPCSRKRPPEAGVYRWSCAGRNNVYLLAHAWSTFKPLHDAYVGGRLHAGMKVVHADGAGTVHTYSVIWWKVVAPTTAASWAWAPLSRPSMTLQTCVGANSQYRLMVRLVQVG